MPENVYEIQIRATDAQNNTHTVEIEGKLPADTPQQAIAKIVEAAMDAYGSGKFRDVEVAGR
jgi:hypothetical protein